MTISSITDHKGGGVYYPKNIDEKTGNMVCSVLLSKDPPLQDPGVESLVDYKIVIEFIDILITTEIMKMVANKLSGSAGLGGFDYAVLKDLLLVHG